MKVEPHGPLAWLPCWSQLSGVLPDGNPDPQRYNDCGETCVAGVIASVRGMIISPGDVRQYLHGTTGTGLTTPLDLVNALRHYTVMAQQLSTRTSTAWATLKSYWAMALPVIILGTWNPPSGFLHWVTLSSYAPQSIEVINPWDGARHDISADDFTQQYAGWLVLLQNHLHFDMSGEPTPGT